MSGQPEALLLADQLRDITSRFKTPSHERGVCNGAIQELRRLHAVNAQMLEALTGLANYCDLRGFNTESASADHLSKALAAIASATGEQAS